MSHFIQNCVFTKEVSDTVSEKVQSLTESLDPLENLGIDFAEPQFYRINCVVFAEPLPMDIEGANNRDFESKTNREQDTVTIENVTIIKTKGKRNKYKINKNINSNLSCPQQSCQKLFPSTTLLKAHIRKVHCAQKHFVCEQCGVAFTAQYLLNRHYLVHSKDKVQCPVCCKMLSKRTNLRVHFQSHGTSRPHECRICHKRFLRRSTMNVHVKFVHKDEECRSETDRNTKEGDTNNEDAV